MSFNDNNPRFIVVEGPVGVGKTTLARRLSESFNTELLLEGADENPFLNEFYSSKKNVAFQTQLFFLFHQHLLLSIPQDHRMQTRLLINHVRYHR